MTVAALYGVAPLRALGENWPLLLSSYLPTLGLMIVVYNVGPGVLFHATFNLTVNPGGFAVTVLEIPSEEAFVVLMAIAVLAGAAVALATRGRLGVPCVP